MEIIWQAVSRRPLITESLVQCQFSLCGICGTQSGNGTNFFLNSSVSSINIFPPVFYTHTFFDYIAVQPCKLKASLNIIIRHLLGLGRYVSASSDSPILKGLPRLLRPLRLKRNKHYFQIWTWLNKATKIRWTHVRGVGKMQSYWMVIQAVYICTTLLRRVNKLWWAE
jgi:hypothetical protein